MSAVAVAVVNNQVWSLSLVPEGKNDVFQKSQKNINKLLLI